MGKIQKTFKDFKDTPYYSLYSKMIDEYSIKILTSTLATQ